MFKGGGGGTIRGSGWDVGPGGGGGGALRFEWVPSAKRPRGAEAVKANILGWSTLFFGQNRGRSTYNLCLYSVYSIRNMAFFVYIYIYIYIYKAV